MERPSKIALGASLISGLGQTALQLSDYHNNALALVLAVTTIAPLLYVGWHLWDGWLERRGKPGLVFQPSYVIILGLLIALGGMGWQLLASTPAATSYVNFTHASQH